MSAQGGTLQRRGTIELPIWPVAVLVIAVIAATIGMTMLSKEGQTTFVTSVSESERLANSTAAVREQGATLPVAPLQKSTGYAGFENPAASGAVAWGSIGGPNEALHRQYSPPQDGVALAPAWGPIMVNGEPCMQCRWTLRHGGEKGAGDSPAPSFSPAPRSVREPFSLAEGVTTPYPTVTPPSSRLSSSSNASRKIFGHRATSGSRVQAPTQSSTNLHFRGEPCDLRRRLGAGCSNG